MVDSQKGTGSCTIGLLGILIHLFDKYSIPDTEIYSASSTHMSKNKQYNNISNAFENAGLCLCKPAVQQPKGSLISPSHPICPKRHQKLLKNSTLSNLFIMNK
jgi:hypothetical protein